MGGGRKGDRERERERVGGSEGEGGGGERKMEEVIGTKGRSQAAGIKINIHSHHSPDFSTGRKWLSQQG